MSDPRLEHLVLYAWVGEDEHGSGEIGIKQGLVPAGMIPLVSINASKVNRDLLVQSLNEQARKYGKKIRLCRFKFDGVVKETEHGS